MIKNPDPGAALTVSLIAVLVLVMILTVMHVRAKNDTIITAPVMAYAGMPETNVQAAATTPAPRIALSFDDGPGTHTEAILDVLEEHGAVATFFVLGYRVERRPELIRRAIALGCELGCHSYEHADHSKMSADAVRRDLERVKQLLEKDFDYVTQLCRPTYGLINERVTKGAKDMGMPMILWSVDTRDWESKNADAVVKLTLKKAKDGDIILFHDIFSSTAEAIKRLVPELIERGFELVTVSELLRSSPPKSGEIYRRALAGGG